MKERRYASWADVPAEVPPSRQRNKHASNQPEPGEGHAKRRGPWLKRIVVAAVVVGIGWGAVSLLSADEEAPSGGSDDVAAPGGTGGSDAAPASDASSVSLSAPTDLNGWAQPDDRDAKQFAEQQEQALAAAPAAAQAELDLVTATYASPDGRVSFSGYTASGATQEALAGDLEGALANFLPGVPAADLVPVDAGPVGGILRCADGVLSLAADEVLCAWADDATLGKAIWVVPGLTVEQAGDYTLVLRDAVTD